MRNIFRIITITLLFVQSSIVHGQINFTNGGGDKLFSNAANWSTGKVPTAAETSHKKPKSQEQKCNVTGGS